MNIICNMLNQVHGLVQSLVLFSFHMYAILLVFYICISCLGISFNVFSFFRFVLLFLVVLKFFYIRSLRFYIRSSTFTMCRSDANVLPLRADDDDVLTIHNKFCMLDMRIIGLCLCVHVFLSPKYVVCVSLLKKYSYFSLIWTVSH